jgi:hypothetical protein
MLTWFCTIFQDETKKLAKFVHFKKKLFIQNWLLKKWYIGATINIRNKKFQNISFEKSFLWKHVSLTKGPP